MKTLDELLAQLDSLETENAALKAQLAQHGAGPAVGVSKADVAVLTAERDLLKTTNETLAREVSTLKAAQADFDGKASLMLAEELSKHGIRKVGVATNHSKAGSDDDGAELTKKAGQRAKAHMPNHP